MSVKAIPDGYHSITPYLIVNDAARAMEFYGRAFDARELMRLRGPGASVMHAELRIGDSAVMLSDANPDWQQHGPDTLGGTPVSIMLYVQDVDDTFKRALDAGAEVVRQVEDQFYGDRSGQLRDPFGHLWTLATHIEDVDADELQRRMDAMMAQWDG